MGNLNSRRPVEMNRLSEPLIAAAGGVNVSADHDGDVLGGLRKPGDRGMHVCGGNWRYIAPRNMSNLSDADVSQEQLDDRVVYGDNFVINSTYTWWNFLPKNLFEQFSNLANLYFLAVGILQLIPDITTTGGTPSMYETLGLIVMVSGMRAAAEDITKHKADALRNGYRYDVLASKAEYMRASSKHKSLYGFRKVRSGDLKVGMIVKVRQDEMIPADMVLLGSAMPKGHCYIDKSNLNGETKLEVLSSIKEIQRFCATDENKDVEASHRLRDIDLVCFFEPPNARMENFRGNLIPDVQQRRTNRLTNIHNDVDSVKTLTSDNLILRETILRNVPFIYGLVVYTGDDTKIQRSNKEGATSHVKVSKIMRKVNDYLVIMLSFQGILCIMGGITSGVWLTRSQHDWYLDLSGLNTWLTAFLAMWTWVILLAQMVPISLIVSVEMVHYMQAGFMQWDMELYYPPIDKSMVVNNSTIHEDLGLIDYIFSDKTGTLTQNRMEFRYSLLANNSEYGSKMTEIAKAVIKRENDLKIAQGDDDYVGVDSARVEWSEVAYPLNPPVECSKDATNKCCEDDCCCASWCNTCWYDNRDWDHLSVEDDAVAAEGNKFTDEERKDVLTAAWGAEAKETDNTELHCFIRHMALSNTVRPFVDDKTQELKFQAESAEELAMVQWAQSVGFTKLQVNPTVLEVRDPVTNTVKEERFRHLATLGFSSARARVSVIYQSLDDTSKITVMTKGQDTVILPLIADLQNEDALQIKLKNLSTMGLRTLVCCHADLKTSWWNQYKDRYHMLSTGDGDKTVYANDKEKQRVQEDFFEEIEKSASLQYLACIGLEDQLQLLVPEAIRDFLDAGVKVWMITGDKLETAKNIGLACNLIDPDMEPKIEASSTMEEMAEGFNSSRLLEITGQWGNIVNQRAELEALFNSFDTAGTGQIHKTQLEYFVSILGIQMNQTQNDADKEASAFSSILKQLRIENQYFAEDGDAKTVIDADMVTLDMFVDLMRSVSVSMYDAVKHDIESAIKRFNAIEDLKQYPVSLLVSRSAFQVLFPPKKEDASLEEQAQERRLERLRQKFFLLASAAKSVVFARAQPAMKKRMVTEIMKRFPDAVTLAVGDGANDTEMITAAHVGVGIAGVEGTAATNSADYAIGTFRMLHTLLFVHGFWSYHRVSELVSFMFYKACFLSIIGYIFGFVSGMSGQAFFVDSIYQIYNVVYTALPVIFVAVLDQKLPRHTLQNSPSAYRESKGLKFRRKVFLGWLFRAILHALIIMVVPFIGLHSSTLANGQTRGLWFCSTVIYYGSILVPTFMIVFNMSTVTILHVLAVFITSIASCFLFNFVMSLALAFEPDLYGVVWKMYCDPVTWLWMLWSVSACLLTELIWRFSRSMLRPSFTTIIKERIRLHGVASPLNISLEEEQKWKDRKVKKSPLDIDITSKAIEELRAIYNEEEESNKDVAKASEMRSAVIRSVLRFRGTTGAQFDSAAQAKFQTHDKMDEEQDNQA